MMFRGVDLDQALERVAETTNINLVYDSELVQGTTVYCAAEHATPTELIRCLLNDVHLDFYQTSGGTYVLTESPRKPSQRGDLTGVVVDRHTGEPLAHAHILLARANIGAASDQSGRFQLPDLTSGPHRVLVTHLGYKSTVDSIRVPPGDSVQHRIALTPTPIGSDPIVVNGVERRAPEDGVGAPTLSPEDMAERGPLATPDALGRTGALLGVRRQHPVADLHVQGGDAGEHEVRLDGMPIRNPVTLRRLLGAFSPLALDRLTVRKAGFGVEHGSTISGVVSAEHALDASSPSVGQLAVDPMSVNAEGHGSADLGPARSAQARVAARSSVWDVYQDPTLDRLLRDWNVVDPTLLASYFDAEEVADVEPAAQTASTGFSDLHVATRVDLSPYQSLSVSGYRGRNHLRSQFVARDPFGMLTQDRYEWANTAGQARLDWTLGPRASAFVQVRASEHRVHRGYQMTYGTPDPADGVEATIDTLQGALDPSRWPDDRNQLEEWTLDGSASYAMSSRHRLKGAVEVSRRTSDFRLGGRFLRPLSFEDTRWEVAGFLRDAISLETNTTLTAGTRLTYVPVRRTVYAEPRLRLHRDGSAGALGPYAVRLAGGLYRQFVNRFEATSTSPTAILPSMRFWLPTGSAHAPPRALHGTVQVQLHPHDRWTVQGETFYKYYDRLLAVDYATLSTGAVPPVNASGRDASIASAIAATNGYALGGGVTLTRKSDLVTSTLRYDWHRSRRRFPSRFDERMVPAPWTQPHQISLSLEAAPSDALRLSLRGERGWGRSWGFRHSYYSVFGDRSELASSVAASLDAPEAHTLGPRTRFDLGVGYTVRWQDLALETRFDVINALDHRNPFDWGVRPARDAGTTRTTRRLPGRRLAASLTVRY